MSGQNTAATARTAGAVPAGADEVSALTTAHCARHAQMRRAASAQADVIRQTFVKSTATSAGSYAATEAANAIVAG